MQHNRPWYLCFFVIAAVIQLVSIPYAYAIETLPEVTVTGSNAQLSNQINNPQELDEEDISVAHERSIADVFQGFTGVSSTRAGGYGQTGTLNIRGAGGLGVVTLDGIPLLQSLPGLLNLDGLPTEAIQSAEIIRGPDVAYQSFQALGGGIRLTTQDRANTGAKFSMEGGSFGILRETLQGALAGDLGRVTLTLNRGDAFEGVHLADSTSNPEREPFRFTQGILRFSSDITSRLNWQGSMLYRKNWVGSDKLGLDATKRIAFLDDTQSYGKGESWLAQNTINFKVTSDWNSQLQLGFTQLTNSVKAGVFISNLTNRLYLANWRNQHTLLDNKNEKIRWQLNWGGQGRHEQIQGRSTIGGVDDSRTMASGFIDTEAQYHNLSGEVGVRVEHFEQYGDHPLFKAATAWQVMPSLTVRASGGTGYRIPSYTELHSLFFGNPQLKPERSASGDLSLEWFPLKNLHLTINGYYNRYDNLINLAYNPKAGPISVNVADASVAGVELDAQYTWTESLDTGVSYTYSDNRDLQTDRFLPLRPAHVGRVWGKQKITGFPITLWAEAVVRSGTFSDSANTLPVKQSVQLNASVRYAVNNQFEVYLRGENLTNNRAPQFYSTDIPGVAVYGGFTLNY